MEVEEVQETKAICPGIEYETKPCIKTRLKHIRVNDKIKVKMKRNLQAEGTEKTICQS